MIGFISRQISAPGDSDDECWSTVIEDKSKQDATDVSLELSSFVRSVRND